MYIDESERICIDSAGSDEDGWHGSFIKKIPRPISSISTWAAVKPNRQERGGCHVAQRTDAGLLYRVGSSRPRYPSLLSRAWVDDPSLQLGRNTCCKLQVSPLAACWTDPGANIIQVMRILRPFTRLLARPRFHCNGDIETCRRQVTVEVVADATDPGRAAMGVTSSIK